MVTATQRDLEASRSRHDVPGRLRSLIAAWRAAGAVDLTVSHEITPSLAMA
jgi:hypothetical protein